MPSDLESDPTLAAASNDDGSAATLPADSARATRPRGDGSQEPTLAPLALRDPAAEMPVVDPLIYADRVELTRGGMGRITAARDRRLGRRIALKELRTASPALRDRFQREALLTARLQHPAIVSVHEAGRWPGGEPFIAMKLVPGTPLDKVIAAATTLDARLALVPHVLAIADALAYAHSQRVVHRDLKPANVLIGEFGETVVIDWGLAKDLADVSPEGQAADPYRGDRDALHTAAGAVLGTPPYMPPEQASGEPVDERADVYAIGAILYHALTGVAPYSGGTANEVLAAVIAGPPRPVTEREPGVPADLEAVVRRAMARDRTERYADARGLADDLRRFTTGQLVGAHRYSRRQLVWRWLRRHRAAVIVASVALAVVAAGATLSIRRIVHERARVAAERDRATASRAEAEELMRFMLFELRGKLDPIGRVDLLAPVAERADAYYRDRPTGAPSDEMRRAAAITTVGDVLLDQGRTADALARFREALAIARPLQAASPVDDELARVVMIANNRIGHVQFLQGDLDAAARAHAAAAAMIDARAPAIQAAAGWRRDAAFTRQQRSHVLMVQGDAAGALRERQAAQAIYAELARAAPTDLGAIHDLAVAHDLVGDSLDAAGDKTGAIASYRAGAALLDQVIASDPSAFQAQAERAAIDDNLGDVLLDQGDLRAALTAYEGNRQVLERLAAQDPSNVERSRALAVAYLKIGELRELDGDRQGRALLAQALERFTQLAARDPSNSDRQRDIAVAHNRLADVLADSGQHAEATDHYRASLAIRQALAARNPGNLEWRRDEMVGMSRLGNALRDQGDLDGALTQYRAALTAGEALAATDRSNPARQADLAIGRNKIGATLLALGDAAGARREFEVGLAIRRALLASQPDNREWQRDVASSLEKLGDAHLAARDRVAAGAAYRDALAILEPLAAAATNADWTEAARTLRRTVDRCCAR